MSAALAVGWLAMLVLANGTVLEGPSLLEGTPWRSKSQRHTHDYHFSWVPPYDPTDR